MPMFVCLFWTVIMAVELKKDRSYPRLHLFVFMAVTTLLYFGHCVFFNHETSIIPLTDTIYCIANLAVYPLYFLYICSLTIRSEQNQERWLVLLPSIVMGVAVGAVYIFMSPEETTDFIDYYLYKGEHKALDGWAEKQAYLHDTCKILFAVLIFPVFFYGRAHIRDFDLLVKNSYADTENKTLAPLHNMLIAFIVTSIASFVVNIIGRHYFANSIWLLSLPSIIFSVLLFCIGFIGYKQKFSIKDIEKDEYIIDTDENSQSIVKELRKSIEQLMELEQLYRQPNLKIADLVKRLGTNRNYIYMAINREMGVSFNEYVNRMRIEHAAMLMAQHPNKTLAEIGEQSGFTSSTSFYRNFKLYKGLGPKEYLNTLKKES